MAMGSLGLINVDLDPCPYQMLMSLGALEKVRKFMKHEIVIQVNTNKPTVYTIIWAQTMVTHVTSYDALVGGTTTIDHDGDQELAIRLHY
jgi:hypothetical protein